jgi:hypothetical protein
MRLAEPVMISTPDPGSMWDFFRTELGKTIRVEEDSDGALRVDMLKDGTWSQAPRGMIGLRLSHRTHRLTPQEILALPFARVRVRDLELGKFS